MTLEGLAELYFRIYSRERPPESRKQPNYFLNIRRRLPHEHIVHLTVLFYSDFSRCSLTKVFEKLLISPMIQRAAELRCARCERPSSHINRFMVPGSYVLGWTIHAAPNREEPFSAGLCARDIDAQV